MKSKQQSKVEERAEKQRLLEALERASNFDDQTYSTNVPNFISTLSNEQISELLTFVGNVRASAWREGSNDEYVSQCEHEDMS